MFWSYLVKTLANNFLIQILKKVLDKYKNDKCK